MLSTIYTYIRLENERRLLTDKAALLGGADLVRAQGLGGGVNESAALGASRVGAVKIAALLGGANVSRAQGLGGGFNGSGFVGAIHEGAELHLLLLLRRGQERVRGGARWGRGGGGGVSQMANCAYSSSSSAGPLYTIQLAVKHEKNRTNQPEIVDKFKTKRRNNTKMVYYRPAAHY